MPAVGELAPDFTLNNQDDRPVTLSNLRGSTVILYFYPRDATPGCTTEACDFRDHETQLTKIGAVVLGISPDDTVSHRKFRQEESLNFPLLADPGKIAIVSYDVWKEKNIYGRTSMGVERSTFIIDAEGVIRKIFPKVKVAGHVAKVFEAVGELGH